MFCESIVASDAQLRSDAEARLQLAPAEWSDSHRTTVPFRRKPPPTEGESQERCRKRAAEVRSSFAPVEAREREASAEAPLRLDVDTE